MRPRPTRPASGWRRRLCRLSHPPAASSNYRYPPSPAGQQRCALGPATAASTPLAQLCISSQLPASHAPILRTLQTPLSSQPLGLLAAGRRECIRPAAPSRLQPALRPQTSFYRLLQKLILQPSFASHPLSLLAAGDSVSVDPRPAARSSSLRPLATPSTVRRLTKRSACLVLCMDLKPDERSSSLRGSDMEWLA